MTEVVIKFNQQRNEYLIYEPTTDTLMAASNLTESLLGLNKFLVESGMIQGDLFSSDTIQYHLDTATMKSIVEGNVSLIKRLQAAPSGFMISGQRFGGGIKQKPKEESNNSRRKSGVFQGATGFRSAGKKFGNI